MLTKKGIQRRTPREPIKERAKQTKSLLKTISEAARDMVKVGPDMIRLMRATWDIQARVDHIKNIDLEEREHLKGALMVKAMAATHMKDELLKIAEEYERLARVTTPEHRQVILDAIDNARPEEIARLHRFIKYVAAAKKEHAATIMERAKEHGIEKIYPIAEAYYHGSPEEKEAITHILKHVKSAEHVERAKYHISAMKAMHQDVKKHLPRILAAARNFEEVDQIMMAAHHASQSLRAGGKPDEILSALKDKKTAIEKFGMPARGWEPYAPRTKEIR